MEAEEAEAMSLIGVGGKSALTVLMRGWWEDDRNAYRQERVVVASEKCLPSAEGGGSAGIACHHLRVDAVQSTMDCLQRVRASVRGAGARSFQRLSGAPVKI